MSQVAHSFGDQRNEIGGVCPCQLFILLFRLRIARTSFLIKKTRFGREEESRNRGDLASEVGCGLALGRL